jgi:DNA-directed RNA polymerase subunit RPC12/RpoP
MQTLAKCKCQHCSQNIEFDSDEAGATIPCPHCGMETMLYVEPVPPHPATATKPAQPPLIVRFFVALGDVLGEIANSTGVILSSLAHVLVILLSLGLFLVGVYLAVDGLNAESEELKRSMSSAIRQNVYALRYCTGFILMALSPLVFAAERFVMWLKNQGERI